MSYKEKHILKLQCPSSSGYGLCLFGLQREHKVISFTPVLRKVQILMYVCMHHLGFRSNPMNYAPSDSIQKNYSINNTSRLIKQRLFDCIVVNLHLIVIGKWFFGLF